MEARHKASSEAVGSPGSWWRGQCPSPTSQEDLPPKVPAVTFTMLISWKRPKEAPALEMFWLHMVTSHKGWNLSSFFLLIKKCEVSALVPVCLLPAKPDQCETLAKGIWVEFRSSELGSVFYLCVLIHRGSFLKQLYSPWVPRHCS